MSLTPQLQSFAQGPAEMAQARSLTYDRTAGLALVAALAGDKLRSHLEALAEVATDKDVKKAARAAAYKLKSAGVSGGVQREATVDLSVKIETEGIAAATAPGFDGRLWLVLPSLPGAGGGELDLRDPNHRIEPIQDLSLGRVRKFHNEVSRDNLLQPPFLVNLDMATHLIGLADEALRLSGKPVPAAMEHFRAWHRRAIALGAMPERASARGQLEAGQRPVDAAGVEALSAHRALGFLAAPPSAFESIDQEFRELLHGQAAIEKADFLATAAVLIDRAANAWAAAPNGRQLAALWLDASADVLHAGGDTAAAQIALAAADDLRAWDGNDALGQPLVARAFKGAIDIDAAWTHREAHMHGTAHHGHEGHDHEGHDHSHE